MQTCNHLQSVHLSRFISSHFPPWLRYSSPPISPFLVMYWYIFTPIQKKGNAKKYSNHPTIVLISYVSEEMLKILQARLQQYVNQEISHVQGRLGKGRGTRDKTVHICWIIEKGKTREFQKKEKHLLLLHWLCLWWCGSQQTVENSSRDGNTRLPYCLLKNLYAGQEATVKTGYGKTDWFQIGKGVCQGYILSPCLFNL